MARIPVGRIATAPCGHRGEVVIGTYVQCLENCELKDSDAPTIETCPDCGSDDIDNEFQLDPMYLFWNSTAVEYNWRCYGCGKLKKV